MLLILYVASKGLKDSQTLSAGRYENVMRQDLLSFEPAECIVREAVGAHESRFVLLAPT